MSDAKLQAAQAAMEKLLNFRLPSQRNLLIFNLRKTKVLDLLHRLREWLKIHPQVTPDVVIRYFNPILNGWSMYYRHACSKQAFDFVKHQLWKEIWKWCRRRHPQKSYAWIKKKYFKKSDGRDWRFFTITNCCGTFITEFLTDVSELRIERHVKIRGDASPDNPAQREYWERRRERKHLAKRTGRATAEYLHDLIEA